MESAQARLNHINFWVVRVSDPPAPPPLPRPGTQQLLSSQSDQITFTTNQIVGCVGHRLPQEHHHLEIKALLYSDQGEGPDPKGSLRTPPKPLHLRGCHTEGATSPCWCGSRCSRPICIHLSDNTEPSLNYGHHKLSAVSLGEASLCSRCLPP